MRLEEPLSRKMPSTSVAVQKELVLQIHMSMKIDIWLRTFLLQENSAFSNDYGYISVDEALSLLVGKRYGHVRISYADLERYPKNPSRVLCYTIPVSQCISLFVCKNLSVGMRL